MIKRILLLAGLLMLLSASAFAGVDTIILGSEEVDADSDLGEMPLHNESELYGKTPHSSGDADGSDATGAGDGVGPSDADLPGDSNAPVPEPATGVLLGMGVLGLARMLRRKPAADDAA